jgi:hypothetical protein
MEQFMQKYEGKIKGVLSGFDRLVLRGTLRVLVTGGGVLSFLEAAGVALQDFGTYMEQTTKRLRAASCEWAQQLGRPVVYLESSQTRKELVAREIAQQDRIQEGLICVLSCVEPCMSYRVCRNGRDGRRFVKRQPRKGLHLYHYWIDEMFGFMSARIQTWFPFDIQVCLNGREWLARQMDGHGLKYQRRENCFVHLSDAKAAQGLLDKLLSVSWSSAMTKVVDRVNPLHGKIFQQYPIDYYWSVHESEWATDVLFKKPVDLTALYPLWVRGGISTFSSPDVMRFLGKKPHGNFRGELRSDYKEWMEGIRVKHRMNSNSVKMYNKQANLVRVETTINDPTAFKSYRASAWDQGGRLAWRTMRKGVADIYRRAEVSQQCNECYMDALASLDTDTPVGELVGPVCRSKRWRGQRVRGLRPWSAEDRALLGVVSRGEFHLNGFRNRDLVGALFGKRISSPQDKRRASAGVTHRLRLLRAHGIIKKISHTHHYRLTRKGREIATAVIGTQHVTLQELNRAIA